MSKREPLDNRRPSITAVVTSGVLTYYGSWSYDTDGRIKEVFLQGGKSGSDVEAMARDAAVATSLALQYGCPPEVLEEALTKKEDGPAGPLGLVLREALRE